MATLSCCLVAVLVVLFIARSNACSFTTGATAILLGNPLRPPVPASFLNCVPPADPNALESVVNDLYTSVRGTVATIRTVLDVTLNGQPTPAVTSTCIAINVSPFTRQCTSYSLLGTTPSGTYAFADFRIFDAAILYDMELHRPRRSTRCQGGFAVEITDPRFIGGLCTKTCAADEFTSETTCETCPPNLQVNPTRDGCVDIDECAEGTSTCGANSECLNSDFAVTGIRFQCICDPGFVVQGTESRVGSSTSTCVLTPVTVTLGQPLPRSMNFSLAASGVDLFRAEVFSLDEANREFKIFSEKSSGSFLVDSLLPGTRYKVKAIILDTLEEDTDLVSFDSFQTPCTCKNEPVSVENGNGKPTNLTASQQNGLITFTFIDQSQCELAYSLSRKEDAAAKGVIFAPDYYYTAENACGEVYTTGTFAADDLRRSRLTPGVPFLYCVRAIGVIANSDPTCVEHVVRWETAVELSVALPPTSGSIPSENVLVTYQLEDASGAPIVDAFGVTQANVTTTQPDGKAQLAFSFVPASAFQVDILNLRFTLLKNTNTGNGTITHQFLCDGGSAPCSLEGNIFPVQNLVFSHEIEVQDTTSVPIEGLVLIGDSGCPLQGAEVCVNAKAGLNQVNIACVQTDFAGRFAVGSVIGARTVVEVTYKEHTFVLSDGAPEVVQANGANGEGDGFIASADKRFTGLVFQDTTTAEITVDVIGGLCNRHLGESTVKYQIRGCSAFEEIFPPQQEIREQYVVYAHAIEVGAEVYGNIDLEPQVVDLTDDFSNSTDPSTSGDTSNEEDITGLGDRYLRFQFDGTFSVSIVNPLSAVPRCSQVLTFRAGALANALITVKESFPPRHVIGGEVADCTTFADDARIIITNKLGVDLEDPKDAQFFDRFKAEDPPAVALELLTLCSNPSLNSRCSAPLIYDTVPGLGEVNGRVLFPLLVGPPNTISPFTKVFTAEFRPRPNALGVQETIQPVVVGDYEEGLVEAVDVPVYEPVMILRDPPGGNSYVTYENVETTIEVTHETFMAKTSNSTYRHGTNAAGVFGERCFGELVELCLELRAAVNTEFRTQSGTVVFDPVSYKDKANTIELSTKWTYSTSNSPWTAGQASDVFVVPSIKLALEVVDQVSLDESCVAQVDRLQKFSGAEDLSVSFLTYDDIVSFTFNETIEQLQNGLEQEPTSEGKDNIRDAIASTRQAIESWEKVLNEYRATNADAEAGVNVLKPYAFFGNISAFSGLGNQYAGLLPKTLVEGAIPLPSTDVANTDLDAIDTITFTGGGSSLSFSLSSETMESNGRLEGVNQEKEDSENFGIGNRFDLPTAKTRSISGRLVKLHVKQGLTISDEATTDTRVSFHFGDTDAGDRFDVKIALDPKFKSFVFVTQSTSRSMCPHEPGTVPRENTRLEVLPTSTSSPVLPDESVMFNLRLTNTGEDESNFLLAIDQKTNPGGLTFNLNSDVVPINFLPGKSSVDFLLEVKRGPSQFEYPAVNVSFRSACEFDSQTLSNDDFPASEIIKRTQTTEQLFNDAATGKIVFAEPCPTIGLAQPDPRNTEYINIASGSALEFVVRNPSKAKLGSLAQQVIATRLNSVKLKFRNVLQPDEVLAALVTPLTDLDFADEASEDDLGFSRLVWNIETNGVTDGVYEVWAEADCETVLGAPPGFNAAPSATLELVVDRTVPRLFEQKPAAGEVVIGQSVLFVFTEDIDCNTFKVDAQVEGITTGFNNHNLDNLLLLCTGTEIAFQFDPLVVDHAELVGKKFDVVVSSVSDLNGNELSVDIVANLSYASLDLDVVGVQFDVVLQRNCTVDATSLQAEIAAVIGVELHRISVLGISCTPTGVILTISILPAEESSSTNNSERRLSESERMAPLSLLYAMAGGDRKERRSLQDFVAIEQLPGYVAIQGVHIDDSRSTGAQSQTIYFETDKAKIVDVEKQAETTAGLYVQQQQGLEELKQLVIGATAVLGVLIAALVVAVGSNSVRIRRSRGGLGAENYSSASGMSSTNPTYQSQPPTQPTKVEA